MITDAMVEAALGEAVCDRAGMRRALEAALAAAPPPKQDTLLTVQYVKTLEAKLAALGAAWQPIETAPLGVPLVLGWHDPMATMGLADGGDWVSEIAHAGMPNTKPSGMSNGWRHGSATYWRPLPPPPITANDWASVSPSVHGDL